MNKLVKILTLIILTSVNLLGQSKLPKNLKEAAYYLDKDCPDIVKNKIKDIPEDSLVYAVYPFAKTEPYKNYKTIFEWTSDEDRNPKIVKYLEKKGIYDFHSEVLLYTIKQFFINRKIDEKEILKKFIECQKKLEEKNKIKSVADSIDGVYIPKDLDDCFKQINSFWNDSTKVEVKKWEEREFTGNVHLGFGMWIRNNWKLWGGSRLSKYFNDFGILHPDDMSGIILVSYHRYLNKKEIKLQEQIKYYQDYWEDSEIAQLKKKEEEFLEYKVGTTIEFNYKNGYVSKEQENKYDSDNCIAKGIITERNNKDFLIKVKIIETCDKKGIIYYDNNGVLIYDPKTKRLSKPNKRVIKKIKVNKEQWFEYRDWEI